MKDKKIKKRQQIINGQVVKQVHLHNVRRIMMKNNNI